MLTIKNIQCDYSECVFQVKSATLNAPIDGEPSVLYEDEFGFHGSLHAGTVYMMNSEGKTVAKWGLTPLSPTPSDHPSLR